MGKISFKFVWENNWCWYTFISEGILKQLQERYRFYWNYFLGGEWRGWVIISYISVVLRKYLHSHSRIFTHLFRLFTHSLIYYNYKKLHTDVVIMTMKHLLYLCFIWIIIYFLKMEILNNIIKFNRTSFITASNERVLAKDCVIHNNEL